MLIYNSNKYMVDHTKPVIQIQTSKRDSPKLKALTAVNKKFLKSLGLIINKHKK